MQFHQRKVRTKDGELIEENKFEISKEEVNIFWKMGNHLLKLFKNIKKVKGISDGKK